MPQTVFTAVTLTGQCRGWTRLESARELTVGETRSTKADFVRFTAGLQKITAAFRLSRKTSKTHFFGLKIHILPNLRIMAKSINHLSP